MKFAHPLTPGTLLRRYKRFLADVRLENGETVVAHSPNTGSMLGVSTPGSRIWLLDHGPDTPRKTRYTWELTELETGVCVGVNTGRSNALAREVIEAKRLPTLSGYERLLSEVRYGEERSRIDLLLQGDGLPDCYVEVKNVTAVDEAGLALFPDAVTTRGQKHMRELTYRVAAGDRAAVIFTIQRRDAHAFRPAWEIDPAYSELLRRAVEAGVEVYPLLFEATPEGITFLRAVPLSMSAP
ncbi:DNA/RNA nuclease SfsA [Sulfurivirga sp.]|uniref:DNA/RNA nuclease SfsA n=1 Tax=Sulfurivirga sp. TaxID=2614236 RepID=UPI0025F412CE|nr:DNA/RNA nuclease SfsA [Sulfurivirga sp.]